MQLAVYIKDIFQLTRAHLTCQIQREPKLSPEVPYLEETRKLHLELLFLIKFLLLSTSTTPKGEF